MSSGPHPSIASHRPSAAIGESIGSSQPVQADGDNTTIREQSNIADGHGNSTQVREGHRSSHEPRYTRRVRQHRVSGLDISPYSSKRLIRHRKSRGSRDLLDERKYGVYKGNPILLDTDQ